MKIDSYFSEVMDALMHVDRNDVKSIAYAIQVTAGKILVIGNGGSATTASHLAGDLTKTNGEQAFCLSDSSYLVTAFANDEGYHYIFKEQFNRYCSPYDMLIAISGSGNSKNILNACKYAQELGNKVIGLTGFDGGLLKDLCDICLIVPSDHMEVIEDVHLAICHCIVESLKQ